MFEQLRHRYFVLLILVLLLGNAFFIWNYIQVKNELQTAHVSGGKVEANEKVLAFAKLFIKEVLQADKEVDFETRLSLENAVRDLEDKEILAEWQNFIGSKTEIEAQNSVKRLLEILINKIQK